MHSTAFKIVTVQLSGRGDLKHLYVVEGLNDKNELVSTAFINEGDSMRKLWENQTTSKMLESYAKYVLEYE